MHRCRALGIPGDPVAAHALHAHRAPGELGEERRIERRVAGVVTPVGAGTGHPDGAHFFRRRAEEPRHPGLDEVWLLRAGPDGDTLRAHVGNRTGGPHARVRLERPLVLRFDDPSGGLEHAVQVALLHRVFALHHGRLADVVVQLRHRRKRILLRLDPRDLEHARGAHGVPFVIGHHCDEILFMDHARALHRADRTLIDSAHGAGGARAPDHSGVKHLRQRNIGHVLVGAVNLAREVAAREGFPDDAVFGRRLNLRLDLDVHGVAGLLVPLDLAVEIAAADQLGVADFFRRVGDRAHHAVVDAQLLDRKPELLRGGFHEQLARFGRRAAQGPRARLDAGAAGGSALVAGERRVAHHDVDLVDVHIELVGHDLRDRDIERLAHVHLAEEGGDAAVGQNRDPGIELGGNKRRLDAGCGSLRKSFADESRPCRGDNECA